MKDIEKWMRNQEGKIIHIPVIDEVCDILKTKFEHQEKIIESLYNKIDTLEDEKWKDKELQKMKEERDKAVANAYRGFPISADEEEAIQDWIENHEKEKHYNPNRKFPRGGAIGGSYTYCFVPTSIGVFGSIKCSCGEEFTFQEEA